MGTEKDASENKKSHTKNQGLNPFLEKIVSQALTLAQEASQSPLGEKVKSQVTQLMTETGPQVAQLVKSYASEYMAKMNDPQAIGMGLEITRLDETGVEAVLPHRWRNRNAQGALSNAALLTLAEFTGQAFWGHFSKDVPAKLKLQDIQGRFFMDSFRQVKAVMAVAGEERERKITELRSAGTVSVPCSVEVYQKGDEKVAEFQLIWKMELMN